MQVISSDERSSVVSDYHYIPGGITNQKLGVLGLFAEAIECGPRRVVLPDLLVFDQAWDHRQLVPPERLKSWEEIYDIRALQAFAADHGVELVAEPKHVGKFGWPFFRRGLAFIEDASLQHRLDRDHLACDFARHLVPHLRHGTLLDQLRSRIFEEASVLAVAQLRIEADWQQHMARERHRDAKRHFDPVQIIRKTVTTLGKGNLLISCDEDHLPQPKDAIRQTIRETTGMEVVFKSDFMPADVFDNLDSLDRSLIDFELAIAAPIFVGYSESSFSSAISFEKFALGRADDQPDYIYDVPGSGLARRTDYGATSRPELAASEYYTSHQRDFWIAQTYVALTSPAENRLQLYRSRLELEDARADEYVISALRVAQLLVDTSAPDEAIVRAFEHAIAVAPGRAEPYHGLARHYRLSNRWAEGFAIATRALGLTPPAGALLLDYPVYEWSLLDEYAVCASWIGHYRECLEACAKILANPATPAEQRDRIRANANFALDRLTAPG